MSEVQFKNHVANSVGVLGGQGEEMAINYFRTTSKMDQMLLATIL